MSLPDTTFFVAVQGAVRSSEKIYVSVALEQEKYVLQKHATLV